MTNPVHTWVRGDTVDKLKRMRTNGESMPELIAQAVDFYCDRVIHIESRQERFKRLNKS